MSPHRSRFATVASLLFCIVAVACAPAPARGQVAGIERVPDGLIFQGAIDTPAVERLERELRPGDRLLIDSQGGDDSAALRLAELVVARDVRVLVNGRCFAQCATYVFVAARGGTIRQGTYLLFGPSPLATEAALKRKPGLLKPDESAAWTAHLTRYRKLLAKVSGAEKVLACTDRALGAEAATAAVGPRRAGDLRSVRLPSTYDLAAVSPDRLTTAGFKLDEGSWFAPAGSRGSAAKFLDRKVVWLDSPDACAAR